MFNIACQTCHDLFLEKDPEDLGRGSLVDGKGFKDVIILPKGTNADITKNPEATGEDRLLTAENKWLIAHADAKIDGAFNGLQGENISVL